MELRQKPGAFAVVEREWRGGDTVNVSFGMEIGLTEWKKAGDSVTVSRGPLSCSLKMGEEWRRVGGTDEWPELAVYPTTPWNYGLLINRRHPRSSLTVTEKGLSSPQPWTPENAPVVIHARGKRIPNWTLVDETVTALQPSPVRSKEPEEDISLIPMGCARLRISCFPTIGEGADAHDWIPITSQDTMSGNHAE